MMIILGIISQFSHLLILNTFPFVVITSRPFIIAVILFFTNHFLAFSFFNRKYYSFSEVMAYFTLCLWLVPFALLVSLSANENILPLADSGVDLGNKIVSDDDVVSNYFSRKGKKYGLLSFFHYAKESILPERNKKTF
ncbi:hypothetical protein AAG570_013263 [Ranatra chinensis]|uniref:Protein TEX261 n=1 Tax=Ranatra chinensis TaxID=642074 RepID=A0ABD0YGA3_9HEMI